MRLKDNKALSILAGLVGEDKEKLSERICHELLEAGIIRSDCDNGSMMLDVFERSEESWPDLVKILFDGKWSNEIQANFLECILMGNGQCELCGGETEIFEDKKKIIAGDGYVTPYEYEYEYRIDKCLTCGAKITIKPERDPDIKHDKNT